MVTSRTGIAPTPRTSGGRAPGAPGRARSSRRPRAGRLAAVVALAGLSVTSIAATLAPRLLAWSPTALAGHGDAALAAGVLGLAVTVELVLTLAALHRRDDLRWLPDLLVPAALAALFWVASPTSRLFVLYVATVGLALRIADETPGPDDER